MEPLGNMIEGGRKTCFMETQRNVQGSNGFIVVCQNSRNAMININFCFEGMSKRF